MVRRWNVLIFSSLIAFAGFFHARDLKSAPETIIVIRHADKNIPMDGSDNLNKKGHARAIDLARMIPKCFGVPSKIVTHPFIITSSRHARSYQTAVPLGVATQVKIDFMYPSISLGSKNKNGIEVGKTLKNMSREENELIVVVWEHRGIPGLADGLGVPGVQPIADDNFNNLYLFEFDSNKSKPRLRILSQEKLFAEGCIQ